MDSICWDCKNAVPGEKRGCSWSREFRPVEGWEALRRDIRPAKRRRRTPSMQESYRVLRCPRFEKG